MPVEPNGRQDLIQLRRDTTADWAAVDPILAQGEPAFDYETGVLKCGDGETNLSSLDPVNHNVHVQQDDSGTVARITKLTQTEYDALGTPDASTLYVIVG